MQRTLLFIILAGAATALNNGLARTPQMGWNNWNSLGCDVSESLLLDTASKLVTSGLRDVGYNYVVLDDCWSDGRDSAGYLRADEQRFPHGMKWMANHIHDLNMLFGMYSSAGEFTCARYEGSLDHETYDAESWASWDVDYLKYDNCYHRGRFGYPEVSFNRYNVMAQALNATGRSILYSLCSWGEDYVHTWGKFYFLKTNEKVPEHKYQVLQLPIHGGCRGTSTTLLQDQTTYAPAQIRRILTALRRATTVRYD